MFIKAVREDFSNIYGTEKYEVGKEYKGYCYYFTDEKNIGTIPEIPGFDRTDLLKTRFLHIEPIDSPYDTGYGHFTSNHIKVIREIPIAEIKNIFKLHGQLAWFQYAEEEATKNKIQLTKNSYKYLNLLFKCKR